MSDSTKTSLILPAYFANEDLVLMTQHCLDSLEPRPDQVILVDDGSPLDVTFSATDREIRLDENSGYTKAANTGLQAATGDILIVGNNDLTFNQRWLGGLLDVLQSGFDIATCWTSDQKNIKLEDSITEGTRFGSLFAMKREVFEKTGGFDETFIHYFGDLDLQKRAEELGFRVGRNNNLVVEHLSKATYKTVDPQDDRYLRDMRAYESKWRTVE
jgi:GT2 family glycosyltransferase